jgi:HK97 gp10 family phage protein
MLRLTIDDRELQQAIRDAGLIEAAARVFLESSAAVVQQKARNAAPEDTGGLRKSIQARVGRGLSITVEALAPHAPFVEFGTRPHMPPVSSLAGWALRKGLNPWAVAMSIARRGTKAQPFLSVGMEEAQTSVAGFLRVAGRSIQRRWKRHGK